VEGDPDSAGGAGEVGGKVGPAGLRQQRSPVSLRHGQGVKPAAAILKCIVLIVLMALIITLHIKGGELDGYGEPLLHHYDIRPVQVIGVVGGVVG